MTNLKKTKRRILALDGGGVKGINQIMILKKIEERTGKKIHELFDLIVGTSAGSITAVSMAALKMEAKEILPKFEELSRKIFKRTFGAHARLLGGRGYYESWILEATLKEFIGERTLREDDEDDVTPKFAIVACDTTREDTTEFVFRNYDLPETEKSQDPDFNYAENWGSSEKHLKLLKCVMASASAPTYFDPVEMEIRGIRKTLVDGGLKANNPVLIAWAEAKLLWPDDEISMIVSIGTGVQKGDYGHSDLLGITRRVIDIPTDSLGAAADFCKILRAIEFKGKYIRLNPPTPQGISLDCTNPRLIDNMKGNTDRYIGESTRLFNSIVNDFKQ